MIPSFIELVECASCGKAEPYVYTCTYCRLKFCADHRLAENHDCFKAKHAKYIRRSWLQKRGQNITSGKYVVACDNCGFKTTEPRFIEIAGQLREDHILQKGCPGSKIFLEDAQRP